jgi:diphthine synthase
MLSFVGLGISGFESIPIEGLNAISTADIVYLEQFTSPIGKSDLEKIQNAIKGEERKE